MNPVRAAIDFALPPRCPACGAIVAADGGFCPDCWSRLRFLSGPGCARCNLPFDFDRGEGAVCAECMAAPVPHDGVRAAVAYGEVARGVAIKLKHGRRIGLAKVIARHLGRHLDPDPGALLLPVPLHRWRIWRRGFNQSALIAAALGKTCGLPVRSDLLVRTKPTPMLRGLGRRARAETLRGAFLVPSDKRAEVKGRTVFLVDDVYTSGATAGACAKVLKRAGAARVVVLCWARVIADELDEAVPVGNERDEER